MILKLELVDGHPNSPLTAYNVFALGSTIWWCFKNNFLSPIPSLSGKNWQPLTRLCTNPLPVKHPITIQDDRIEPIYLAFRSEITPALQAI